MPESANPGHGPGASEHHRHIPAPVELPIDGPEEMADDVDLTTAMVRFVITGAGSAVLDFGLTMLLQYGLGWDPAYAKALGFVLGTTTAYLINRRWTFRAEPSAARFVAVIVLYLATFAVQVGIYTALEHLWATDDKLMSAVSFVIAQGTATVINFVVQRVVIFKLR